MSEYTSASFGFGEEPIELFNKKGKDKINALTGGNIEANMWLPFAAKKYLLSTDINDYVIVPVPMMFSDLPNTNGDSVTIQDFLEFNPDLGMQAFKTFRGKPTFTEHENKDRRKAKGAILDVFLRKINGFGQGKFYKLVELLAWDRTKDPLLVNDILSRKINSYSIGFHYNAYTCSICNRRFGEGGSQTPCEHTAPLKPTYLHHSGILAYKKCHNINGFETSAVVNPAYAIAVSDSVTNLASYF